MTLLMFDSYFCVAGYIDAISGNQLSSNTIIRASKIQKNTVVWSNIKKPLETLCVHLHEMYKLFLGLSKIPRLIENNEFFVNLTNKIGMTVYKYF